MAKLGEMLEHMRLRQFSMMNLPTGGAKQLANHIVADFLDCGIYYMFIALMLYMYYL